MIEYESALSFFDLFRLIIVSHVLTGAITFVAWQSEALIMLVESFFYDLWQAWIQDSEVACFVIIAKPSESARLIEQLSHDGFDEIVSAITVLSKLQAVVVVERIELLLYYYPRILF